MAGRKKSDNNNRALLELLFHVSSELAGALDLRTVLQRVLYETIQNVGGERCSILVLDDSGNPVDSTLVFGKQVVENTTQQMREPMERGLAGWVIQNRKGVYIPDTVSDDRWLKRPDDDRNKSKAQSAICVPLQARDKLVGILTLVATTKDAFSAEQVDLMQAIADQAGVAVLNARLFTESQRRAQVMTALAEGAAAMNTSLQIGEVFQRILMQTMQALQVETVALGMIEEGELVFRTAAGHSAGNVLGKKIKLGTGIAGKVASEGRAIIVPDVEKERGFGDEDKFAGVEIRALLVAPIQTQGHVIGVLEAINPIAKNFDPDALLIMTGIGGLAGTTIQNAQLFERLRAAHKRYRELFEESIDPIVITDWEGNILESNREVSKLSGYTHEELNKMSIDQLHEVNWNRTGMEFENLRSSEAQTYESSFHPKTDAPIPIEVHVLHVEFESNDSIQWILRDISERKQTDRLREDLTSMIYHDLRSPLANIVSSLDVISNMVPESERNTVLSIIKIAESSTGRIQRLVDSLLDISRLESGVPIQDKMEVSPSELVREALDEVSTSINGRNQIISSNIPADLPDIWIDHEMALRVLINLVENASKYSPTGGSIDVNLESRNEFIHFMIKDQGSGIPASELDHIFDKFTRIRGSQKVGGLGIGLAFCRLVVQGHGGKIWATSEEGNGSIFHFTFPIVSQE